VELNIDGSGQFQITTGIRMFDHLLSQLAQHGVFDIKISASGPDQHHVVEDVAISLGKAFNQALGKKQGIVRMAHAIVPMDEALAAVAVDIGGRIYNVIEGDFDEANIGDMDVDLVRHFLISFASEAKINLHARIFCGINDHHKAEALFKALGRTLDTATRIDERLLGRVPSTKEVIEG
jgi:imidazoleglycerol-phosphate dehydratase